MATSLEIERNLKLASETLGLPLYAKYELLRARLFTQEYAHWATRFPGGNDHGPGHISRVLEKLDQLIDGGRESGEIREYELFLTMMAVLYHDIGLLRGRANHAESSALLVEDEKNDYIVDARDRDIIGAAVMTHSSSKNLAEETAHFDDEEIIGGQAVRPRLIAALVRLADELDEDYRRADPLLQTRLELNETSRFYWEFSQRISGIQADYSSRQIRMSVVFEPEDAGRFVIVDDRRRSFIAAFAEKIAKINRERVTVNQFLPDSLRYREIRVTVRPVAGHSGWRRPRKFVFDDHSSAEEFLLSLPELHEGPASEWMTEALAEIRENHLQRADALLERVRAILHDLPKSVRQRYYYDSACLNSMRAHTSTIQAEKAQLLDATLRDLKEWIQGLLEDPLRGEDPHNAIHRMTSDNDLHCVLGERRSEVVDLVPENLRNAISSRVPPFEKSGCFPRGTHVLSPRGHVRIEDLRMGDEVYCLDDNELVPTTVSHVQSRREARCWTINGRYFMTGSQPVATRSAGYVPAMELEIGDEIITEDLSVERVGQIVVTEGRYEVFSLTVNHRVHNYVAGGIICHNDKH